MTENLVFSLVLFKNSQKSFKQVYLPGCVRLVSALLSEFPSSRLALHVDDSVSARDLIPVFATGIKIKVFRYPGSIKWVLNAMRYRSLWELQHDTVVSCDAHDEPSHVIDSVSKALQTLEQERKQIYMTYWLARGKHCDSQSCLPIKLARGNVHAHSDGGLIVWKPGKAKNKMTKCKQGFLDFVCEILEGTRNIPRGIDEMLLDAYLDGSRILTDDNCLFFKHDPFILSHEEEGLYQSPPKVLCYEVELCNLSWTTGSMEISVCAEEFNRRSKGFGTEHDDKCYICSGEGELILCDVCQKSFHLDCHVPAVKRATSHIWSCSFCIQKDRNLGPGLKQQVNSWVSQMDETRSLIEYEVEELVGFKYTALGKHMFLVKWKGWQLDPENHWEPASSLSPELIAEYIAHLQ